MTRDVPPSSSAGEAARGPARRPTVLGVAHVVCLVFAIVSLGFWGYYAWPFPWPGVLFMIGAPLFAIVVWGLFRSPRALVRTDPVGKALVEIAVMGAAVAAWFMLGYPVVGGVFAVVAIVTGVLTSRREGRP